MMVRIKTDHLIVFSLTFTSYALYHAARKTLSGVKSSISEDWIGNGTGAGHRHLPLFPSEASAQTFLGTLDALFMICYAVALIFWGWIGDRFNPLAVVVFGMVGSAISLTAFGSLPFWLDFYSVPWYIFTWASFGIVQACGWPNEVAIMANWFPHTNRVHFTTIFFDIFGFIMGLWAACQPLGNILGALIISLILPMGYQATFVFNSLLILIGAAAMVLFVSPRPPSIPRPAPTSVHAMPSGSGRSAVERIEIRRQRRAERTQQQQQRRRLSSSSTEGSSSSSEDEEEDTEALFGGSHGPPPPPPAREPIGMWDAICLPSVLPYCLCNACLKFVNYAFFFWLPFYLTYKYRWAETEANQLATWYDIGGIFGSILGGIASDRLGHRSPVLFALLLGSLPLLFLYASIGANKLVHIVGMWLLGFTISGPYNLIVGTIAVDLGSQPALAGNAEAMSTVTGLIDGTGSAGSAIGQLFVPIIQNQLGWQWVFYLFILMNFLSAVCLLRRFLHDMKLLWMARQSGREHRRESQPLLAEN